MNNNFLQVPLFFPWTIIFSRCVVVFFFFLESYHYCFQNNGKNNWGKNQVSCLSGGGSHRLVIWKSTKLNYFRLKLEDFSENRSVLFPQSVLDMSAHPSIVRARDRRLCLRRHSIPVLSLLLVLEKTSHHPCGWIGVIDSMSQILRKINLV
jgi:hypothetical protein